MRAFHFVTRHWRLFGLIVLIVGAAIFYRASGLSTYLPNAGIDQVRNDVLQLGWKGVAAYLAVYVLIVTLGLPNLPLQLAAGAIYGVWGAFAMMYVGVNLGALSAFFLARIMGRKAIEEILGNKIVRFNERIERGGTTFLLILRLVPLMPFNAINYCSGVSRLKTRQYVTANVLGMFPLTFVHVFLGHAAGKIDFGDTSTYLNAKVLAPLIISLLAIGLAVWLTRRKSQL